MEACFGACPIAGSPCVRQPPSPLDLDRLTNDSGLSASKMTAIQTIVRPEWRNYTRGEKPRDMNSHMLFSPLATWNCTTRRSNEC